MPTWVKENWVLIAFVAVIATAFVVLRSKPSDVSTLNELDQMLASGQPTVVSFYSNF
jgi:hypothetical protein